MDLIKLKEMIIRQLNEELTLLNSIFILDPYFKLQFVFTHSR